jgi:hypothetical protein
VLDRLRPRSNVAIYLRTYLRRAGLETDLEAARVLRLRGVQVSAVHMQRIASGRMQLTARMCNALAIILKLTVEERHRLARAAAKDHGYDIGSIEAGPDIVEEM